MFYLLEKHIKEGFVTFYRLFLRSLPNVFAFVYVKANFMEICERKSFPSLFRKMLTSTFLSRFKSNFLEKALCNSHFSLWIFQ